MEPGYITTLSKHGRHTCCVEVYCQNHEGICDKCIDAKLTKQCATWDDTPERPRGAKTNQICTLAIH